MAALPRYYLQDKIRDYVIEDRNAPARDRIAVRVKDLGIAERILKMLNTKA